MAVSPGLASFEVHISTGIVGRLGNYRDEVVQFIILKIKISLSASSSAPHLGLLEEKSRRMAIGREDDSIIPQIVQNEVEDGRIPVDEDLPIEGILLQLNY